MKRPFMEDPEPPNENDPELMEEVFMMMRHLGWKPEDLRLKKPQDRYRKWIEAHTGRTVSKRMIAGTPECIFGSSPTTGTTAYLSSPQSSITTGR